MVRTIHWCRIRRCDIEKYKDCVYCALYAVVLCSRRSRLCSLYTQFVISACMESMNIVTDYYVKQSIYDQDEQKTGLKEIV